MINSGNGGNGGNGYIFSGVARLVRNECISSAISSIVFPSMSHMYIGLLSAKMAFAAVSCKLWRCVI